jgi:DNA-binding transcriptional ArsR family regulator
MPEPKSNEWFNLWGIFEDDGEIAVRVRIEDLVDTKVSFPARILRIYLRQLAASGRIFTYTQRELGEAFGVDERTARRWMAELRDAGLLEELAGTRLVSRSLDDGGLVYFIQSEYGGPIKIGVTNDPSHRLATLQTGHPSKLHILAVTPGGTKKEKEIHDAFSGVRISGEWFKPTPALMEYIDAIRNADDENRRR